MLQPHVHNGAKQNAMTDSTPVSTNKGISLPAVPVTTQFTAGESGSERKEMPQPQAKPFQLKSPVQHTDPEYPHTAKALQTKPFQLKINNTGLPDKLKSGMEALSGFAMDDVKVHYNSVKPAQLQALAYAQGNDIHVGPGQERHLPHEAWHVVQQKQGRVHPTMQMKDGTAINDDHGLEQEADTMGAAAMQLKAEPGSAVQAVGSGKIVQRVTVKVGSSPKDQADFKSAEPILMNYLGGSAPVSIDSARLAGEGGKTTNIWAHMSDDEVGGMSHEALAALLIEKGYRSSAEIRMIGCNLQGRASVTGPAKLWHALFDQLSAIILKGHTPSVPTIYATKGPLHTGGSTLAANQHFYVVDKNDPGIEVDEIYIKEDENLQNIKAAKMRKWAKEDKETVTKEILEKYAEEVAATSADEVLAAHLAEFKERMNIMRQENEKFYEKNNSGSSKMIREEHLERKSRGYDESQRTTNKYPSIFKPNEDNTGWIWNDTAWVSYSGPAE